MPSEYIAFPIVGIGASAGGLEAFSRIFELGDDHTMLTKMERQLDKLIALIGELLDVTKIEAGQFAWHNEPFDLDALVRDIVEEVRTTTERHQICIEGALSTLVFGNREHISQVLINLLSNAVKYSPQATGILVKMVTDADIITIGVQDFGIGIAPEKHGHLFERFFRVSDPASKTFPGLGLGLFISEQIVKRHGGRMWVESCEGVGSTFFFTIPLVPQSEPTIRKEREE